MTITLPNSELCLLRIPERAIQQLSEDTGIKESDVLECYLSFWYEAEAKRSGVWPPDAYRSNGAHDILMRWAVEWANVTNIEPENWHITPGSIVLTQGGRQKSPSFSTYTFLLCARYLISQGVKLFCSNLDAFENARTTRNQNWIPLLRENVRQFVYVKKRIDLLGITGEETSPSLVASFDRVEDHIHGSIAIWTAQNATGDIAAANGQLLAWYPIVHRQVLHCRSKNVPIGPCLVKWAVSKNKGKSATETSFLSGGESLRVSVSKERMLNSDSVEREIPSEIDPFL